MKKTLSLLIFFFLIFQVPFSSLGLAEEKPVTSQMMSEIEGIKARIATIEKQQQDIAAKDDEILAKLDQLRVWVHRK